MTLHEATKQVLMEHGGVLTPEEVCRQINDRGLYKKKNGTPLTPGQVLLRVMNYPDQFEAILRLKR